MATTTIWTYQDAYEHLLDWNGSSSTDAVTLRQSKRAVLEACRGICNARLWAYYNTLGRITTVADYDTGTIQYTHSTRAVALTTGTWPTWAAQGVIQIANVEYQVDSRTSSSEIILSVNSNPGANVASGTSYELYRDTYTLPVDFTTMGSLMDTANGVKLDRVELNEWNQLRSTTVTPSQPRAYAIGPDPDYQGVMAVRLSPPPDAVYVLDYPYRRQPRQLQVALHEDGTVTTSSTVVTGVGTAFTSKMVGSVIRFGSNATTAPTGIAGANPFVEERIITGWTSATVIAIDSALTTDASGYKYTISDPIDLEQGAMYTAFLRAAECHLGGVLNKDNYPILEQKRLKAELLAREADNRSFDSGSGNPFHDRLAARFDLSGVQPS